MSFGVLGCRHSGNHSSNADDIQNKGISSLMDKVLCLLLCPSRSQAHFRLRTKFIYAHEQNCWCLMADIRVVISISLVIRGASASVQFPDSKTEDPSG